MGFSRPGETMTNWFDLSESDDRAIAAFMTGLAASPVPGSVQDPSRVWWKAQLLKQWDAERRAQRPVELMQPVEIAGALTAAVLLLYWSLPHLF
jgi:hypothetical protein